MTQDEYEEFKKRHPMIGSSRFSWEKYGGKLGVSHTEVFQEQLSWTFKPGITILGWCPSSSLVVRARTNGIAVLFVTEEDPVEAWFHVSYDGQLP